MANVAQLLSQGCARCRGPFKGLEHAHFQMFEIINKPPGQPPEDPRVQVMMQMALVCTDCLMRVHKQATTPKQEMN